ncbi:NADPH-dependent FMN reductase [Alkalicoccobacillus plakortidis]|uniref:NAD(P)H-dependent oxidoreductase n=1 Tax=Alkalicoccobacillus plakortidis TaxID=444060 RepID=A0ABT0XK07_9BACI|nr:NADPH-dependent FMN reductase [Alkalicoccobacillus plakortidis]MCM2676235.1 NAD(P)H-dependent oxidoreductase [Alkalicoccobacillus plakortidis]
MSFLKKLFGNDQKEEVNMAQESLKIGIILGSTRQGRVSPQVGEWVKKLADERGDATYEIVDIADYELPFLGTTDGTEPGIAAWNEKLASLDGFVFIAQEYNHSISGSLKNALDFARDAWYNKAAGIVSYGSTGGARAAEHLRGILGELKVADVRTHPTLSLFLDFENGQDFKPQDLHHANITGMLDEVNEWSTALKTIRK